MKYWETDEYKISVEDWIGFLKNRSIFSEHDIAVVEYIYDQPNYQATATEIGKQFDFSYQKINSKNTQLSRRVLEEIGKEPYIKQNGKKRYWHVLFTIGEDYTNSNKNYTNWLLRENLRLALSQYLKKDPSDRLDDDVSGNFDIEYYYSEGKTRVTNRLIKVRNLKARKKCLELFGYNCKVCGFNAEEVYGEKFFGIINVHHLNPLSEINDEDVINPKTDLIPLCPNCHAAVHKRTPPYTLKELKDIIKSKFSRGD